MIETKVVGKMFARHYCGEKLSDAIVFNNASELTLLMKFVSIPKDKIERNVPKIVERKEVQSKELTVVFVRETSRGDPLLTFSPAIQLWSSEIVKSHTGRNLTTPPKPSEGYCLPGYEYLFNSMRKTEHPLSEGKIVAKLETENDPNTFTTLSNDSLKLLMIFTGIDSEKIERWISKIEDDDKIQKGAKQVVFSKSPFAREPKVKLVG